MASSEHTNRRNTTLPKSGKSKKSVSFSSTPNEIRGLSLMELSKEGFNQREIKEILQLRADVATSDWESWPLPPDPVLDSSQGTLRHSNTLPSQRAHSRVYSRSYPKTGSKILDESQIPFIIDSLFTLIKDPIRSTLALNKKIGLLIRKKRAINTLRVLYGIDLNNPQMQNMYEIDLIDIENIDSELEENIKIMKALNDRYHNHAPDKGLLELHKEHEGHEGGHIRIKSKKRISKNKGVRKSKKVSKNKKFN
jgi:hypothetical protein